MTAGPRLSVIVVSRHRAEALHRCLTGLGQQIGAAIEVIVVADPAAADQVRAPDRKVVAFDEANISAARNLGLGLAAGDVVAFIDDDAVPEPTWAARLLEPFGDAQTVAATGFVRGRNGISLQWRCLAVDRSGQDHPIELPGEMTCRPDPGPDRVIKTQGTNCAFRAEALRRIGGFDPAFRFYLDETDVNLRMAGLGQTAVVPLAQVHHGFLPSERRRADRVPRSLHDIAASSAVFLRRHAADALEPGRARLWAEQRQRLERHLAARRLSQAEAARLMRTLEDGWAEGMARPLAAREALPDAATAWLPMRAASTGEGLFLAGWIWKRRTLADQARAAVAQGRIVSVLCLSPGMRRHWLRFDPDGYWVQTGGVWGRADRSAPLPIGQGFARRCAEALSEFCRFRPVG